MWFWISRRIRLWLLFAVAAPVAAWALGILSDLLERGRGETPVTRTLRRARGFVEDQTRGPVARRRSRDPRRRAGR